MSASSKMAARDGFVSAGLLLAIRAFALIAFGISAYLAWHAWRGGSALGCGPDSGCDRVLNSRWAFWFGVPVSVFALMTYVIVLGASLQLARAVPVAAQRRAWAVLVPAGLLTMGAALWFVSLQLFVIKSICPYCMAAHMAGFITGVLLLLAAPFRNTPEKPWEIQKQVFVPARFISRMFIVAFGFLAVLVGGQIAHAPPTSREINPSDILAKAPPPASAAPITNAAPKLEPRTELPPPPATAAVATASPPSAPEPPAQLATAPKPPAPPPLPMPIPVNGVLFVYDGRFALEVNQVPVIGSPTNRYAVVSLFDYTCHHCRMMHPILVESQRLFRDQLVILSLPMPLDPACNQTMTRTHPDHTNACAYARIGLTVWRADRAKHHEFDDWMFTGEKPPALSDAREKARQLVGPEAFDRAAADPWVAEQLKLDVAIYELAYRSGQGSMPQLILGPAVAVGTYPQDELTKLFVDKLGLKPQP